MKLAEILIIEDDPADRELLTQFFKRYHFCNKIHYATAASAGRLMLAKFEIDLIICDVNLPDESGIEFAEKLNASGENTIPIVCLSHNAEWETLNQAERAKIAAYIQKPLNMNVLFELMETLDFISLGLMLE